jgi:hypothetical protein
MKSLGQSLLDWIAQLPAPVTYRDMAAVLFTLLLIRLARHAGMWIYAVVALPGTAVHELAHFVVAFVLGARPSFPSLVPTRTERGWRLGEVRFRPGHLRAMFVGLAPVLLAPLALWWATTILAHASWPIYILHAWIVAALLSACWPSATDWRLAFPAIAVLLLLALLVGWYYVSVQR